MTKETKAVSTLLLILLLLCSAVLGAIIAYVWVMANYYNMPEDTTMLLVENIMFPVTNFTYFNLTVLNPSNSALDVNITAFLLTIEGTNETYSVTTTEFPRELPFLLQRGTRQTFKCTKNWSNFAGETVRIEPAAANASIKSYPYVTPKVKLTITPDFDSYLSVEFFNLTLRNLDSIVNITVSEIELFGETLNCTPSLPVVLPPNEIEDMQCNRNWDDLRGQNVTITARTPEGYESVYETNKLSGAIVSVDEIKFDYTDTTYFNLTILNSEDSDASARLSRINLTIANETAITLDTVPPLTITEIPLSPNQSLVFKCLWNWRTYRNETITVHAHTKQGFTEANKTTLTPLTVVWNVTDVKFDLDDTNHFLVNVTNTPCSLQDVNVTTIQLGDQNATLEPPSEVLANGTEVQFSCGINWTTSIGQYVDVTVFAEDGSEVSGTVMIPYIGMKFMDQPIWRTSPIPHVNITISNSNNSLESAVITRIVFKAENQTYEVDGTLTYPLLAPAGIIIKKGENVTVVCPWNWTLYGDKNVTIVFESKEGFSVSQTFHIPVPNP